MKNSNWKGDDVGYTGLHEWVNKNLGQPTKCEHCPKDNLTGKQIHWANKDHLYKRNLKDWIRLCPECHAKYDKENNNKGKGEKGSNFTLRLSQKLHKKFHVYCLKNGTNMTTLIRELIEQEMKNSKHFN